MDCYGRFFGRRAECSGCELGAHCREAGDPPMLCMHPAKFQEQQSLEQVLPEYEAAPVRQDVYSRTDLLEVIGFMMSMDATTLELLDAKLGDPEISFAKLARRRNISRQAVHKFVRERCERIPELAAVLQNRGRKNQQALQTTFMEEVCRIRRRTHAKRLKRPATALTGWRNLTCSNRNFDLSKMSILKGAAIWRND